DAARPDIEGDNPRTIRLVLDAHHSIPFQLIEADGRYEAPPRFRATLRHNGCWDTINRRWGAATPTCTGAPTQYQISLFEGALRYTFVAVREDVPDHRYYTQYIETGAATGPTEIKSYHERPYLPNQLIQAGGGNPPGAQANHDPYSQEINPGFGIPYYAL